MSDRSVDNTGKEDYFNDDALYMCIITNSGTVELGLLLVITAASLCPVETLIHPVKILNCTKFYQKTHLFGYTQTCHVHLAMH